MLITERIKHLLNKSSASGSVAENFLLSKEVFRNIINREQDRTNRTGDIFCLVVFMLPEGRENQDDLKRLTETLSECMRSIDVFGWLDSSHVGILLPETDSAGAHGFASKISGELHNIHFLIKYKVFPYPSDRLGDREKSETDAAPGESERERKRAPFLKELGGTRSQSSADYMFFLTRSTLKRGFDLLGASVCLVVLSPLFLVISVFIKVVAPGPAFFKQQRIGYAGQPFTFLKFRTMCHGAETSHHQEYLAWLIKAELDSEGADAPMAKLDHDPQIIPFGNLLRKSCLDELPQLINVLRGEMSLVGPRPPIPYEVKEYLPWHRGRFDALPGMTGLWQVNGKNKLSFREMVRLDIRYSRKRSVWLDISILLKTPMAILEQLRDRSEKEVNY